MEEAIYTRKAELYDLFYQEKEYGEEVDFIAEKFNEYKDTSDKKVLVIGCGTGNHSKYLEEKGFEVTGVDKNGAMLEIAREKSGADFMEGAIPGLDLNESFDLVLAPFAVINYVDYDDFSKAIDDFKSHLKEGGVLIFDNGFQAGQDITTNLQMDVIGSEDGSKEFTKFYQSKKRSTRKLKYVQTIVGQEDGQFDFFTDEHDITLYDNHYIEEELKEKGFEVERVSGYGSGKFGSESLTIFVAY